MLWAISMCLWPEVINRDSFIKFWGLPKTYWISLGTSYVALVTQLCFSGAMDHQCFFLFHFSIYLSGSHVRAGSRRHCQNQPPNRDGLHWVSTATGGTLPSLPPSIAFLLLDSVYYSTAYSYYQDEE